MAEYRAGQKAPESGIYKVRHDLHQPNHEVIVLKGAAFPHCIGCPQPRFTLNKAILYFADHPCFKVK